MFLLFLAGFIGVTLLLLLLLKRNDQKSIETYNSKNIIQRFEPDNASPPLSDMINFHKKSSTIKYEI